MTVLYKNTLASNAKGGTELMASELTKRISPELLDEFQIFVSRMDNVQPDPTKIRLYWCHDLAGDPAVEHFKNGGWDKFHRIIFASNWQMQSYIQMYDIPWSRCIVLQNAIEPIPVHEKPCDVIRLAYWSTPHRGLNILVPVFTKLCEKHDNIELDVYSSFKLYGWQERDKPFEELFEQCRSHPKINYHGTVDNQTIRDNLTKTHIHAYPSIWQETSCITLMEAMSAGLVCVHPNYGALYETAAGWTVMYQWLEDLNTHAQAFYQILDMAIEHLNSDTIQSRAQSGKLYADAYYSWDARAPQWENVLRSLLNEPRALPEDSGVFFNYKT